MDIRVYLIPQNECTIAHYLAMYDDLYCQNIYNFFNQDSLLELNQGKSRDFSTMIQDLLKACKDQGGDITRNLQANLPAQVFQNGLQSYMQDAIRNFELKIFKAELVLANGKKLPYFFTNRLELGYAKTKGTASVYEKLACLRNICNATSAKECEDSFDTAQSTGFVDGI